jgi:hypothetical protein
MLRTWSHFLPREEYDAVRKKIDEVGPFLTISVHDFASGIADEIMRKSKHQAIDREMQRINRQMDRAQRSVDDIERLLGIETRWLRSDAEYRKTLEYISNRKFVRVVEELQGLVVSRLMELDKVNLAGSGGWNIFSVGHL